MAKEAEAAAGGTGSSAKTIVCGNERVKLCQLYPRSGHLFERATDRWYEGQRDEADAWLDTGVEGRPRPDVRSSREGEGLKRSRDPFRAVDGAVVADQTNVRICVFVFTSMENQLDG